MSKKILVVEDDPDQKILTEMILEFGGYTILSAASGGQALAQAARAAPNLVLLDVMLDDEMDGFDVLSHLKSHAETAGIPVIMLTADMRDEQKDRALEMGAVDYMTKPYNAKELILHVRRYLANP